MIPPVFPICAASVSVTDLIGTDMGAPQQVVRLYPCGEAPQGVVSPYATWVVISGSPGNYLGDRPDVDGYTVQIDVWGDTDASVTDVARALRDALEPAAYVVSWRGTGRDKETKRYRFSFDVAFTELR